MPKRKLDPLPSAAFQILLSLSDQDLHGYGIMRQVAEQTGGRFFEAKKKESVDDDYAQIAEELRTQFMLGYTPPKDQSSGYHSIHLTAKKKDLTVQTRAGYYSGQ